MQRFKNILFVMTHDSDTNSALERAVLLANHNQADLTVVDVIKEIPTNTKLPGKILSVQELQARLATDSRRRLEALVSPHSEKLKIKIETKVLVGSSFIAIIREVLRNGHDLVIKAAKSEGESFTRLFGSEDMHLLRKCPCPVLMMKPQTERVYHRILAAVDVDDSYSSEELEVRHALNIQTLEMACSLALSEPAELHIVYVWYAPDESFMNSGFMQSSEQAITDYVDEVKAQQQQNMDTLIREVSDRIGADAYNFINVREHLVKGSARKLIPALSVDIDADLMILGTVARTGIPGFIMGNTAETILNQLDCSVLAIKPPGFVSPVKE